MRRLLGLVPMAIAAFIATGCATMSVSSHVQRGLDVTQYRTYDWGAADALPSIDPRLDRNMFKEHLERAVENELKGLGFERSNSGSPDLLIHCHATVNQRMDVDRAGREYGYCYDDSCRATVVEYDAVTIVLDLVDARTNRVIWRGWAQDSVEHLLDSPETTKREVTKAVTRMLARFGALTVTPASRAGELGRGADVTPYQTYDWAPAGRLETGDPRLDDNPFLQEQVQANVEKQLASKGLRKDTSGTPDLLIHYDARVTQRIDIVTTYEASWPCHDCEAYLYEAGTLMIDFVDARTNQLVWSGWADKSFDGAIDDQDRMEKTIEKAVAAILETFPR